MKRKIMMLFMTALISLSLVSCNSDLKEEYVEDLPSVEQTLEIPEGEGGAKLTPDIIEDEDIEEPEEAEIEEVVEEKKTEGQTPLAIHGKLSVSGTNIVDKNGEVFQLCGVSTHGLGWFPEYVNEESFKSLRDDMGANVVRLAMYTAEGAGYCTGGNRDNLKTTVINGVEYATNNGMYVIIDWHILHDLDPNVYKEDAKEFFNEMSLKYANYDNVIYEICNEPNGGTNWQSIKEYANEVIPVIRANDPDAIIIVGTPNWSQDVDEAAKDPITGYDNIMYAVHFYADTHKEWLRDKVDKALKKGLPVFISEFSICDASGNGNNNIKEANKWIEYLDKNNISFVAWNLSNKNESSSLISAGCQKKSGWSYDELSESGKWLAGVLNTHSDQGSALIRNGGKNTVSESEVKPGNKQNKETDKQTDNKQNSENDKPKGNEANSGAKGSFEVSATESNSWESGEVTCVQYTLNLNNKGNSDINNWTIEIEFDRNVEIDQIWCSFGNVNGNVVTVTPESYNSQIEAGKATSDVGLIVKSKGKASISAIKIK